jgi:hypothetical protein
VVLRGMILASGVRDWYDKMPTVCRTSYREIEDQSRSYIELPTCLYLIVTQCESSLEVARHSWLILQS